MSTVRETWGFGHILTVDAEVNAFCRALNAAAVSRGIAPHRPSDALDLSRDLMIGEAAATLGAEWAIVGDTLRLWPRGVTVDWDAVAGL